jgi:rare lipoprotein A (peptidoglycan hydrolase)
MKQLIIAGLLLGAFVLPLTAQQREEGVAVCYHAEGGEGQYATHKTYPFGTKLVVINPVNRAQVTVQVGGRPASSVNAMVEISPQTADTLGIYQDIPTWVWIEAVPVAAAAARPAMRPRIGSVKQAGIALAQTGGLELTASHPSIPIGTRAKLTNPANGRSVTVTIRGRILAATERMLELSRKAAQDLGIQRSAHVQLETIN